MKIDSSVRQPKEGQAERWPDGNANDPALAVLCAPGRCRLSPILPPS